MICIVSSEVRVCECHYFVRISSYMKDQKMTKKIKIVKKKISKSFIIKLYRVQMLLEMCNIKLH